MENKILEDPRFEGIKTFGKRLTDGFADIGSWRLQKSSERSG